MGKSPLWSSLVHLHVFMIFMLRLVKRSASKLVPQNQHIPGFHRPSDISAGILQASFETVHHISGLKGLERIYFQVHSLWECHRCHTLLFEIHRCPQLVSQKTCNSPTRCSKDQVAICCSTAHPAKPHPPRLQIKWASFAPGSCRGFPWVSTCKHGTQGMYGLMALCFMMFNWHRGFWRFGWTQAIS